MFVGCVCFQTFQSMYKLNEIFYAFKKWQSTNVLQILLSVKIYQLVSVYVFQIFPQNYHYKSIVSIVDLLKVCFAYSLLRSIGFKG